MGNTGTLTAGKLVESTGEGLLVLGMTLFFPFIVHLFPSWDDSPLGAHLLPIFYAPLCALLMGRVGIAIVASALAPWVNHLLTGQPAVPMAFMLCLELAFFGVIGGFLLNRRFPAVLLGPLAYVLALFAVCCLGSLLHMGGIRFPLMLPRFIGAFLNAIPGICILGLIGYWMSRHRPQGA